MRRTSIIVAIILIIFSSGCSINTQKENTIVDAVSGVRYTMIPTSNMMTINGRSNCRQYRSIATINGKIQQMTGIACRQADGTWQAMNTN
ncbi:MAG TPA: hypothetical protein VJN02_00665 [Gammaproteobacteria bacterium]|nr:hypothetical protein [Gammaproteobacteria bacterium]